MTGGNISKWTVTYFTTAIVWLIGAEALMVAGFGFPNADVRSPDTLVIVHMIGIGWLSMAMCGALFQFVPVLVAKPLYAERWSLPAFLLLTGGLFALLAGFLALGGRLPVGISLLPVGAVLLLAGFALVVVDLGMTLWRARPLAGPARFVVAGLVCLCVTAMLGGIFAFVLGEVTERPILAAMLASGVPIHAIMGLGGWLTFIAMGVSYRLLAMFMLSQDIKDTESRRGLFAGTAALAVTVSGGIAAILASRDLNVVLSLAALGGVAALAFYGRDVIALYLRRKRRMLELNTRMAVCSFASLAAAAMLGLVLAATGSFVRHVGALVFLVAFGWLSGLILAKLFKIVAFLTWLEMYAPVMGRAVTPRVQEIVVETRAAKWFVLFFAAVWSSTAALLVESPVAFRATMLMATIATVGIAREFFRARRLLDVEATVRIPAGASIPGLLLPRN